MVRFIFVLISLVLIEINLFESLTDRSDDVGISLNSKTERWGEWNAWTFCNEGQWAKTYAFRSEADQGDHKDDVGAVAVRLICEEPGNTIEYPLEIDPTQPGKNWGSWYGVKDIAGSATSCGVNAWLIGYRSKVEEAYSGCSCGITCPSGCVPFDDAAMTCIQMKCSDGMILQPTDCRNWGLWGIWTQCSNGYICGFREKFEEDQGASVDETGLNGVSFKCCHFTDAPTPTPTDQPTPTPTPKPTPSPTPRPTPSPTTKPTKKPSEIPTISPTKPPTKTPTNIPSINPSKNPSKSPTNNPSVFPTQTPTKLPSNNPSKSPTKTPTNSPTINANKAEEPAVTQLIHIPIHHQSDNSNAAAMGGLIGALVFLVLCLCCLGLLFLLYLWRKKKKLNDGINEIRRGESASIVSTIHPIEGSSATTGIGKKSITPHGYDVLGQTEHPQTMLSSSNKKEELNLIGDHSSDDEENIDAMYDRNNSTNNGNGTHVIYLDDEDEDVVPNDDDNDDMLR